MAPTTMLAGRFHERGKIQVEEVEVPKLEKGEVRIKVAFAGTPAFLSSLPCSSRHRHRARTSETDPPSPPPPLQKVSAARTFSISSPPACADLLLTTEQPYSDLHECYEGPFTCCPVGSPHPLTNTTVPATLGHEFSGVIEEVGEGVDAVKFKKGTKVCV
jgi:hypothetical protein